MTGLFCLTRAAEEVEKTDSGPKAEEEKKTKNLDDVRHNQDFQPDDDDDDDDYGVRGDSKVIGAPPRLDRSETRNDARRSEWEAFYFSTSWNDCDVGRRLGRTDDYEPLAAKEQ